MALTEEDKQFIREEGLRVAQMLLNAIQQRQHFQTEELGAQLSDLRRFQVKDHFAPNRIELKTDFPVAFQSPDHIVPWGTKNDNTRGLPYCLALERHFKRPLRAMDMGCAGGGIVFDFLARGHQAIGLEGSDFSQKHQRAEWKTIGDYLYTCDIAKPFSLIDKETQQTAKFDAICMWEVLEHINEQEIAQLFANIRAHLADDGLFVGSIGLQPDIVNGVNYHVTVKPQEWWREQFAAHGLPYIEDYSQIFQFSDFCRGTGNGPLDPDFSRQPHMGCHFVARKAA